MDPPSQTTTRRDDGVAVTVLRGRVEAGIVRAFFADVVRLGGAAQWLIDARAADGFAPAALTIGSAGLRGLRAAGLRRVVVVATQPVLRMAAQAAALASATPLVVAATPAEAEDALRAPLPPDP